MSKPIIALTIATLTCASASGYLWQEVREEREQSASLQQRITQLEDSLATASRNASPEPAPIAPAVKPADLPAEPSSPPTQPPSATLAAIASPGPVINAVPMRGNPMDPEMRRRFREGREQQLRMLKDPEYRDLMRAQQKISMGRMYSDLEPLLGLTEDESDRLLDVLAEQQLRTMEQQPSMGFAGEQMDHAAIQKQQKKYEELRRQNDAEVAQLLGPKFDEWKAYQTNGWSRSQVMRLRQTLSMSDQPLRQDQIKPLVEAIAYEQKQMGVGVPRNPNYQTQFGRDSQAQVRRSEEWLERTAQSQQRIRDGVSGLLTPKQFEQLQQQHAQELKMMELNVKQQRVRAEAQARGEIPPDAPGGFTPVESFSN
jgi:hypothetical protein